MTYSKDGKTGLVTLALGAEESKAFENGFPVIKKTGYRYGLVEIRVEQKRTCPTVGTCAFLREFLHADNHVINSKYPAAFETSIRDFGNTERSALTVEQVFTILNESDDKFDGKGLILADLNKFIHGIGGEVPASELL
jgi:hypothetical protein